jgi:hypothetical protein
MFQRNMSPLSLGLKSKPGKKPAQSRQKAELYLKMEAMHSSEMLTHFY